MQELPIRGPRVYIAIADARSRSTKRSPILPPPHAMGALPAKPAVEGETRLECLNNPEGPKNVGTLTKEAKCNKGVRIGCKGASEVERYREDVAKMEDLL